MPAQKPSSEAVFTPEGSDLLLLDQSINNHEQHPVETEDAADESDRCPSPCNENEQENNECPACRTHCASRRSLRDDPNYDSLIAALYPDIEKHEEEELTLHEEEKARNKQIQASITQTLHRQLEVLGRKRTVKANASATIRRSNCRYQRRKYRASEPQEPDNNEDANENGSTGSSLADEDLTEVKPKRLKRWEGRCSQPSSAASADGVGDENDSEVNRESLGVSAALSPSERLHLGASDIRSHTAHGSLSGDENDSEVNRESLGLFAALNGLSERLHWGAGGMRSNTRHGSLSGGNGKKARNSRLPKLVDCLQNLEEKDDESALVKRIIRKTRTVMECLHRFCRECIDKSMRMLDIHLMLVSIDEQRIPCLQRPYLCCRPTLLVRHLCQYVALQTALQASEIEIYLVKELYSTANMSTYKITKPGLVESVRDKLEVLKEEETLGGLGRQTSSHSHLILAYQKKENRNGQCQV
ncbi:hypothetical protein GOBAR_DD06352 [Gossypium barbadense]|nr:hypothetical protein GOBAR_DD06352 [Gossypium barbadense]